MLIDTHCHLTDKKFSGNVKKVVERARVAGVKKIIMPSTNLEDAKRAVKIAGKYEGVYCLVGVHPEHVDEAVDIEDLREIVDMDSRLRGNDKRVVGVGEIGLDFHYDKEKKTRDKQIELLDKQLELALELELPVAIHAREAKKEIIEVLNDYKIPSKGVFHCWGGDREFLEYVLDKGFYVSFCGNITYKNNNWLVDLMKQVPLNRLLLETDAPYLSPEPLRGELNEPKNVKITARFMADVLDISLNTLINQTTKNSLCLFRLEN
jgi:TatD DNase family protein